MPQHSGSDLNPNANPETSTAVHSAATHKGSSSNPGKQNNQKGLPKKRNTHFLCFPLVTEASIPQLDKSLRHFRNVTTVPGRDAKVDSQDETSNRQIESSSRTTPVDSTSTSADVVEPNENQSVFLLSSTPDLQILPAVAHRPPGTFHLTLGVMDLSTKKEMDRALGLLQEVDYAEIFRELLSEEGKTKSRSESDRRPDEAVRSFQASKQLSEASPRLESLERPVSPPPVNVRTEKRQPSFDKTNPPQISLTGLSTFPSAKSSRVFYAKPSPSLESLFPLLEFGKAIQSKFREAGFITETRPLVLHATVANMKYAAQARGGRTSKGKSWRLGKARWQDGQVDARELIKCFDACAGDVDVYIKGGVPSQAAVSEFTWAQGIIVNRVAICKMGAEKSDDPVLGMVYPPVGEKEIFS